MRFNREAKAAALLLFCMTLFGCTTDGGLQRWGKCALAGAGIGGGVGGIVGSNDNNAGALAGAAGGALLGGLICAFIGDEPEPAPRATPKEDVLVVVEPVPVPVPVAETLGTVHFKTSSAELDAKAKGILQDLAKTAKANAILDLTVIGYTDNTGEDKGYDNKALSKRRGEAVKKYLKAQGVPVKQVDQEPGGIIERGNATKEGRADNRKVDIIGTLVKEKPEGQ